MQNLHKTYALVVACDSYQGITKHLKNIFESGELERQATCSILELVQKEGNRMVHRNVEIYNLLIH